MLEFIQTYWSYIATGILIICEVILFILKKRPQVVDNSLLVKISTWILEAESKFKCGADKMNYVLSEAAAYLGDKYSEKDIRKLVEFMLTLPQKKEK